MNVNDLAAAHSESARKLAGIIYTERSSLVNFRSCAEECQVNDCKWRLASGR